MTHSRVFLAACGVALLAACSNDVLFSPAVPLYTGGALFQRAVWMGNSLTAGFQSGGINDTTQRQSYALTVANQMGSPYYYPSLVPPGCPPPFTNVFTQTRLGGGTATTCLLRNPTIPPFLTNVAVPGAEVLDIFHNGPGTGTNSNALTQLFLGGRTQVQAMTAAHPTFVTVWIGNNDVLGAALANDTTLITRADSFQARYTLILDSITAAKAQALLIGIGAGAGLPGRTAGLPYFSLGSTYFSLDSAGRFAPAPFTVLANCQHPRGDTVFVSFPVGAALIQTAAGGTPTTLDCSNPAQVLLPAVVRALQRAIATFDTFIATQAATRGWAYIDFNATFDSLAAAGKVAGFPLLGQPCSVSPFGAAFSCDGIHPSAASHHLIAQKIVQAINAKYSSAIPAIP